MLVLVNLFSYTIALLVVISIPIILIKQFPDKIKCKHKVIQPGILKRAHNVQAIMYLIYYFQVLDISYDRVKTKD